MRLGKGSGMLGLTALAVIASPFAQAQDTGWYAGANVGLTKSKIDNPRITNSLLGDGFTSISIDDKNKNIGFKVFAGYEFNRYFSLEGGYFNLGHFSYSASTVPAGTLNGDIRVQGINFDPVLNLPFTEKFSGFVRAGVTYAQSKDAFNGAGAVVVLDPDPKKEAFGYKFGGGLQYDFTKTVGMRLEAERYRINDAVGNRGDIDMLSLGLLVRFGRQAPPVQAAAAPEPLVPAPVPVAAAPLLVVVPVAAATQQYCTILDIQFNIDKGDIQPEDKEKLKVVGTFMAKYPDTTAVIEGHADNVGTPEHNLTLSKQRADSVVAYLVDSLHIDRARLTAVGYGDSRPVADNSTEDGKRQNRRVDAVIACVTDTAGLTVAPARMTMALFIDFDKNKANIKPEYDDQLRRVADFMKANPSVSATVEGHTGNLQGTPKLTMEISLRRAQNVVDSLVNTFGIDRRRLTVEGFGDNRRFAYNTSVEGEQENRRVNVIFTYPR